MPSFFKGLASDFARAAARETQRRIRENQRRKQQQTKQTAATKHRPIRQSQLAAVNRETSGENLAQARQAQQTSDNSSVGCTLLVVIAIILLFLLYKGW